MALSAVKVLILRELLSVNDGIQHSSIGEDTLTARIAKASGWEGRRSEQHASATLCATAARPLREPVLRNCHMVCGSYTTGKDL
jgi:hypothetical protein